ncbi:MAG: nuclear transport factor 2 family protein [Novosphingobium sp.]|nr:nuclear transport factor 2 family protein [Novosphingobium sp.]
MNDQAAIQIVLTTYSQTASSGEWDAAVGTYMPDGVWEIPHLGMKLEGQQAIRGALTSFMAEMDYVMQMNAPALIEVNGDTATARAGIRECGKSKGKNEGFEFFGFYVDDLVRTDAGWKFARRSFEGLGTSYFPLVSGEAHKS